MVRRQSFGNGNDDDKDDDDDDELNSFFVKWMAIERALSFL